MVYAVIGIALLCLSVKGYCGKKTSCFVNNTGDAYLFNLLRMLFCSLIGIILVFAEGSQAFLYAEGKFFAICALAGISNTAFLVGWILAIRKNAMVSVDVSLTLGSLIPAVFCAVLFAEPISVPKMIGFTLIVLATVILAGHSKKTAEGGIVGFLLLIFAAIGDGMTGFAQQLYRNYDTVSGSYPKTVYHFYTYVFAALCLLALLIGYRLWNVYRNRSGEGTAEQKGKISLPPRVILHIFVMAVCMFAANYFQTVAANDYGMSSQVLYPIIKGGCLITVNFTAMLFFGEKITRRSVVGSLVALVGIISMSIL